MPLVQEAARSRPPIRDTLGVCPQPQQQALSRSRRACRRRARQAALHASSAQGAARACTMRDRRALLSRACSHALLVSFLHLALLRLPRHLPMSAPRSAPLLSTSTSQHRLTAPASCMRGLPRAPALHCVRPRLAVPPPLRLASSSRTAASSSATAAAPPPVARRRGTRIVSLLVAAGLGMYATDRWLWHRVLERNLRTAWCAAKIAVDYK